MIGIAGYNEPRQFRIISFRIEKADLILLIPELLHKASDQG